MYFVISLLFSLAGLVRTEYESKTVKDMATRTSMLFQMSAQLKWLADTFKLFIVVVNQVLLRKMLILHAFFSVCFLSVLCLLLWNVDVSALCR